MATILAELQPLCDGARHCAAILEILTRNTNNRADDGRAAVEDLWRTYQATWTLYDREAVAILAQPLPPDPIGETVDCSYTGLVLQLTAGVLRGICDAANPRRRSLVLCGNPRVNQQAAELDPPRILNDIERNWPKVMAWFASSAPRPPKGWKWLTEAVRIEGLKVSPPAAVAPISAMQDWPDNVEKLRDFWGAADCVPDEVLQPFIGVPTNHHEIRRAINTWSIKDGRGPIYLNSEYAPERPQTPPLTPAQLRNECATERRFYCDGDGHRDSYMTAILRTRVDRIIQEQRRIPSESTLILPALTGAESPERLLQILEEVMVWCEGPAEGVPKSGRGGKRSGAGRREDMNLRHLVTECDHYQSEGYATPEDQLRHYGNIHKVRAGILFKYTRGGKKGASLPMPEKVKKLKKARERMMNATISSDRAGPTIDAV